MRFNRPDQPYLRLPATPMCPKAPVQVLNGLIRALESYARRALNLCSYTGIPLPVHGAPQSELCCHHEGPVLSWSLTAHCWVGAGWHCPCMPPYLPTCLNQNQQSGLWWSHPVPSSLLWILGDRRQQSIQGLQGSGMTTQMSCYYANTTINQSSYSISSRQPRALELSGMAVGGMPGSPLE